jgi:pimeloyl-ACP methyl ester carboxylesterase
VDNPRTYGAPPFRVAVVHGGPGAPGSVTAVARELAATTAVLEPVQTARSLDGQVRELQELLARWATPPLTLVGWSWGAWLSVLLAARHPALVRKLVLVGSAPFEQRYVPAITATRLARLTAAERRRMEALRAALADPATADRDATFAELGGLATKADAFEPLPAAEAPWPPSPARRADQSEIYRRVWPAAARLRAEGTLLERTRELRCPVVAIHGDHDPHPAAGVREPLERTLPDFRFVLLDRCGHEPWRERHARDPFYALLRRELGEVSLAESS